METKNETFDKSQYHWLAFKAYKFAKKLAKYTIYILTVYAIYSAIEWMME